MSLGEHLDNMLFVHKREYYIALKMNELDLTHINMIDLRNVMSENNKLQENTSCDNIDMHLKIGTTAL